jgi:hypothetical protein
VPRSPREEHRGSIFVGRSKAVRRLSRKKAQFLHCRSGVLPICGDGWRRAMRWRGIPRGATNDFRRRALAVLVFCAGRGSLGYYERRAAALRKSRASALDRFGTAGPPALRTELRCGRSTSDREVVHGVVVNARSGDIPSVTR